MKKRKASALESSYMDIKLYVYRSDLMHFFKFHINLMLRNSTALPATVTKKCLHVKSPGKIKYTRFFLVDGVCFKI